MLVLTRKVNERIFIQLGDKTITVQIVGVSGDRVRVGIDAPPEVPVHREEVARRLELAALDSK
jgi:carbon storage regulator